ncbi:MAG: hypothetical protein ACLQHF_06215 [Terracidiphilus sp.]
MIKNQQFGALILVALCAVLPALAQAPATRTPAPRTRPPYTVEFKTTHVQTLANGTTITTETKEVMARDQEMRRMNATTNAPTGDRPAITTVHVNDPTTGEEISWTSESKVAHDVRRPVGDARHGCWATPDGRYRANYGNANAGCPLQPPQPLQRLAGAAPPVASPLAEGDFLAYLSCGGIGTGSSGALTSSAPPGPITTVGPGPDPGNVVHEDLGADTFMGVAVRGSRTTVTTPAGVMGNDQPLVRTDEIWMAPSLGMVLRSMIEDPRMGQMDREAVSVDLNNPDPALFQPPAGYELDTEEMQPVACPQ